MSSERPAALLIDDGELDDVNELLKELGTRPRRLRGGTRSCGWCAPDKLLVVSGRRALDLDSPSGRDHHRFTTIAIVEEPSRTLRSRLSRMGFDHVLSRPVQPDVLEWMLESALQRDRGQRSKPRLPAGCRVRWRSGWRRRDALLIEISARGCTVLADDAVSPGSPLEIILPSELAGGRELALKGRPARYRRRAAGGYALSILFDALPLEVRQRLADALGELESGLPAAEAPMRSRSMPRSSIEA